MDKNWAIAITFLLGIVSLAAQTSIERQVFSNAGAYHQTSSFNIGWTFGEPVVETLLGNLVMLTQGFQQPDTSTIVKVKENSLHRMGLKIYPNPTAATLTIEASNGEFIPLDLSIFDINGRLLSSQKLNSLITPIDVTRLPAGIYILRFINLETKQNSIVKLEKIK